MSGYSRSALGSSARKRGSWGTNDVRRIENRMYISSTTLTEAVSQLQGTANHLIKVWFTLKEMGLKQGQSVLIDTQNSTPALNQLFSCGDPSGRLFVPFAHSSRWAFMKGDASRSIIQTTIQRWNSSNSVVTVNPSAYLDMTDEDGKIRVSLGRIYPQGLGYGEDGFALEKEASLNIPLEAMAAWYFRRENIGQLDGTIDGKVISKRLVEKFIQNLHLDPGELEAVFSTSPLPITISELPIEDSQLYDICNHSFSAKMVHEIQNEDRNQYTQRIQSVTTINSSPAWTNISPSEQLDDLIAIGEHSILLFGPPRTGKTREIDKVISRTDPRRETIQLHEGWGYENLILGMAPGEAPGEFRWTPGPLLKALREGKRHIVLEEINRTRISQALGELFSLIESSYRGSDNEITLPDDSKISIDPEVTFYFTMNNLDNSTEDVDDALMGRVASIYFGPRVEELTEILNSNSIPETTSKKIRLLFSAILENYPLGHGYFAGYEANEDFKKYYLWRIRPVLMNHFMAYEPEVVAQIDNRVDELFATNA